LNVILIPFYIFLWILGDISFIIPLEDIGMADIFGLYVVSMVPLTTCAVIIHLTAAKFKLNRTTNYILYGICGIILFILIVGNAFFMKGLFG
jgi:hypothetical protein